MRYAKGNISQDCERPGYYRTLQESMFQEACCWEFKTQYGKATRWKTPLHHAF